MKLMQKLKLSGLTYNFLTEQLLILIFSTSTHAIRIDVVKGFDKYCRENKWFKFNTEYCPCP